MKKLKLNRKRIKYVNHLTDPTVIAKMGKKAKAKTPTAMSTVKSNINFYGRINPESI